MRDLTQVKIEAFMNSIEKEYPSLRPFTAEKDNSSSDRNRQKSVVVIVEAARC